MQFYIRKNKKNKNQILLNKKYKENNRLREKLL